jgi:hypothetical protein
MTRRRFATITLAVLSVWVLASSVVVHFPRARAKLVTVSLPASQRVTLSLAAAARIPGDRLVLICRVRNVGAIPVTIAARLGGRFLGERRVPARGSTRLDFSWARDASPSPNEVLELSGVSGTWTLDYAEIANLHGFTRGAVEGLVLPSGQTFTGPPIWTPLLLLAAWTVAARLRPDAWPRWARAGHDAASVGVAALWLVVAIAPVVSPYRIALSVHTFLLALALMWLPAGVRLVEAGRRSAYRAAVVLPGLVPERAVALLARLALALVMVGYAALLWMHMGAYAGGADSSGYMNNARLLSARTASTPIRRVEGLPDAALPPAAYVPLGFRIRDSATLAPTYPVGLPLLVAAAAWVVGWTSAPAVVMLLHAVAGVLVIGLLAVRCGLSPRAALLAMTLLATSPVYLFMSVQLMSDTPALVWATLAVVLCSAPVDRARWRWTDAAAGAALSVAVLVRPTNVLIVLPVAVCLGLAWPRWAAAAAGGLPAAALLLAYNTAAYGHAITTGYGDASSAFRVQNVGPSVHNYLTWLPVLLTPLGVLALGLPLILRRGRRKVVALIVWSAGFLGFYACYYHTHETWWYLRFLLPAFPALIVGAVWVGSEGWHRWPRRSLPTRAATLLWIAVLLVVVAHNVFWGRRLEALEIGRYERVYPDTAAWVRANVASGGVVLASQASGALFYYTALSIVRWDQCGRDALERVEAHAVGARIPLYAVFFPFEIEEQHAFERIPGRWARAGRVRNVTVWRLVAIDRESSAPRN